MTGRVSGLSSARALLAHFPAPTKPWRRLVQVDPSGPTAPWSRPMIFYVPKIVLLALAIIYHPYLGRKTVLVYIGTWLGALILVTLLPIPVYFFFAFEAVLAIALYLHVKIRQAT